MKSTTLKVTDIDKETDFCEFIRQVKSEKKTGSLTVNFSQGGVGTMQWTEKVTSQNNC